MTTNADLIHAVHIDDLEWRTVTTGITGCRLTATGFARGWLYDFEPGSQWPEVDHHTAEERYFVISGEIVDNGVSYPAGSYVTMSPGSEHRPTSPVGARMIGISDATGLRTAP